MAWLLSSLFSSFSLLAQPAAEDPAAEAATFHVVVIGSSTAAGHGPAHPRDAWVNRYRQYLRQAIPGSRVTNLAMGGYQTYQLLPNGFRTPPRRPQPDRNRNISMAVSLRPDLIILNAPSNDVAAGYGFAEQQRNFEAIVATAQAAGIPIWITTTQPRMLSPEMVKVQEDLRDWILAQFGAAAIDFWRGLADCAGWLKSAYDSGDGTHLNAAGHALLYERVVAREF